MKLAAWTVGVVALAAAAGYSALSLYRWEWNRALYFAVLALGAEVALATAAIIRTLGRLPTGGEQPDDEVVRTLREHRPAPPDRFAWLVDTSQRTNVFVTFLVGGGVVISAAAWVVDRVASRTSAPSREHQLAVDLSRIGYPGGGLLPDEVTALAQTVPGVDDEHLRSLLRRPSRSGR